MSDLKRVVTINPPDHDSNSIRWQRGDKQQLGYGYISKDYTRVGLIRCPECEGENYAPNVASGICALCGFDGNES